MKQLLERFEELNENRLLFLTTYVNVGLIVASVIATRELGWNNIGAICAMTAIFLAIAVAMELK